MNSSAHKKAALLYTLPVLAIGGVWFFLLFRGNSVASSAGGTLWFMLIKSPSPNWFRWLLVLPCVCAILAFAHLSPLTRTRAGSLGLLVLGLALAATAWFTVAPEIALFVSLPLLYGFVGVKQAVARGNNGA